MSNAECRILNGEGRVSNSAARSRIQYSTFDISAPSGRPDIQQFAGVMMTHERKKGFFVSFDYTGEALAEIQQFFKTTGKIVIALTVKEILEEQIARKLA